ncbi:MAG: hypothetical protein H0T97_13085 [Actinobacteria bacterium]|nr:hypothetical protein [Actinomycetota bacterium]
MRTLRELLVLGFVAAFVVVYGDFILEIWRARANGASPPRFNDGLLTFAGALAGILGGAFAIGLGIAKPVGSTRGGRLGPARNRFSGLSLSVTLGIWAYALVGAAAATTTLVNLDETPDPIKALSSVFVGYILTLGSTAFREIRPP